MIENSKKMMITGIGSALVDLLVKENDDFLMELGKEKGGMTLVETGSEIDRIVDKTSGKVSVVPGGAACNTIIGIGRLGGAAKFIGMRGDDAYGELYEKKLRESGVIPRFFLSPEPTGKVLSIITPDAQRSMYTFLGASTGLDPASVTPDMFRDTAIAVIEGYLLFNRELMTASLEAAKQAGALVALDLASFEVIHSSKDILENIIKTHVDILIVNEDEAHAYAGFTDEEEILVAAIADGVAYAALKVGRKGSFVCHKGEVTFIEPVKGREAVDTTGAGDLWAAGFLYGLANGYSIEKSGEIASMCGYEVVQVVGAQIPEEGWERIRKVACADVSVN